MILVLEVHVKEEADGLEARFEGGPTVAGKGVVGEEAGQAFQHCLDVPADRRQILIDYTIRCNLSIPEETEGLRHVIAMWVNDTLITFITMWGLMGKYPTDSSSSFGRNSTMIFSARAQRREYPEQGASTKGRC